MVAVRGKVDYIHLRAERFSNFLCISLAYLLCWPQKNREWRGREEAEDDR